MRTTFTIILAILLAASAVAWRMGRTDADDARTRLSWATMADPVRESQTRLFNAMYPDLNLTIDPANQYLEKIIVQSLAGIGPDVFDAAGAALHNFVLAGIAADLTDVAPTLGCDLSRTWPALAEMCWVNGRQVAFPVNVYGTVLFYNKAIFDRCGEPLPSEPMTWDAFIALGTRLREKSMQNGVPTFHIVMGLQWYELLRQAGGRLFDDTRAVCTLDSPEGRRAFQYYYDLHFKYHLIPTPAEQASMPGEGGMTADFLGWFGTGRLAMVRLGSWGVGLLQSYPALAEHLAACEMPFDRHRLSLLGARFLVVNAAGRHRDQAMRMLEFLVSKEFNDATMQQGQSLPPLPDYATVAVPTQPTSAEASALDQTQAIQRTILSAAEHGVVQEVSPFISPVEATDLVERQVQLMLLGTKSPSQAVADAQSAIQRVIDRNLHRLPAYRQEYRRRTGREYPMQPSAGQSLTTNPSAKESQR